MKLTTREISDKSQWESFVQEQAETPFFQSWQWGEVQRRLDQRILRLGLFANSELKGIVQIIKVVAKRGTFYHLRHGPLFEVWNWDWFDRLTSKVKELALDDHIDFLRVSPLIANDSKNIDSFRQRGFRDSPVHNMDGEIAWVLDLESSEAELLANMRKTTRYLVRRAMKMGVTIVIESGELAIKEFLRLYHATARRQHFVPHRGIAEEIHLFGRDDNTRLYFAQYQGKLLAAALIIFYGNQAVYHHSATAQEIKDVPASYLLQWEAIREAKRRGLQRYNFWGVVPPGKSDHPWYGLSLFKMGFGGRLVEYLHAQDLPLSSRYLKTYMVESFFRIRKGYH